MKMKAEQYIKDFTKGCSNELENGEYEYWLTPWQAEAACNLKKEETIEKACNWIKANFNMPDDFELHFRRAMGD